MERGYWLVLLTALISGASIFLNKFGVEGINPYVFTWSKNILVSVFLLVLILFFKEIKTFKTLNKKQWLQLGAIGLVGGSVPFLLFFKGLAMTPSTTSALLHKSMFIFVAVFAVFFLKEKLNKYFLAGAGLLFLGNLLLIKKLSFGFGISDMLIILAVLLWSVETIISKKALAGMPSRIVALGRMGFGVLFILVFLLFTSNISYAAALTLPQIGWIVFTSVLLLLYVSTWYAGLQKISASSATCILVLGSAITTLLSFAYSGTIAIGEIVGVGLIMLGTGLIIFYSKAVLEIKDFISSTNKIRIRD
ncbi:MAG: DMT family transporter [Nanoarchaeota archaeon]|nr:DMT family transporter [Nanoarchaeota archaeon]